MTENSVFEAIRFDEIGAWSELKHEIVKEYAAAYSTIFSAKKQQHFKHYYIDAFSGAGLHISKATSEVVPGSPLNALTVQPPFQKCFFIDLDGKKISLLRSLTEGDPRVQLFEGDCNEILHDKVLPQVRYNQFERALCLLDPYGLHLDWEIIRLAAQSKTIDIFLNFPIMDMNRNAIWRNPEGMPQRGIDRMNRFWGDDSWRQAAYEEELTLFGMWTRKTDNSAIVKAFQKRLREVAGFAHVPEALAMKNSAGAEVYYLFFASHNPSAGRIAQSLFKKHR
jgi:three-Cys-motif partner protein